MRHSRDAEVDGADEKQHCSLTLAWCSPGHPIRDAQRCSVEQIARSSPRVSMATRGGPGGLRRRRWWSLPSWRASGSRPGRPWPLVRRGGNPCPARGGRGRRDACRAPARGIASGLEAVLAGGSDIADMVVRGRARAGLFTWERSAREHARVWSAIGQASRGCAGCGSERSGQIARNTQNSPVTSNADPMTSLGRWACERTFPAITAAPTAHATRGSLLGPGGGHSATTTKRRARATDVCVDG